MDLAIWLNVILGSLAVDRALLAQARGPERDWFPQFVLTRRMITTRCADATQIVGELRRWRDYSGLRWCHAARASPVCYISTCSVHPRAATPKPRRRFTRRYAKRPAMADWAEIRSRGAVRGAGR